MTLPLYFSIFWIIGIIWTLYFWCSEDSANNHKVNFNTNANRRGSRMSIESSDESDNENYKKRKRKLKYETKTRWPSRTSVDAV